MPWCILFPLFFTQNLCDVAKVGIICKKIYSHVGMNYINDSKKKKTNVLHFWLLVGTYYKKTGNLNFFRGEFGPFFSEKKTFL